MKVDAPKVAFASAIAMGIFYALGALTFYIWPVITMKLTAQFLFLSSLGPLTALAQITWINFISGMIQSMIYTFIFVWLWFAIYNKMVKK